MNEMNPGDLRAQRWRRRNLKINERAHELKTKQDITSQLVNKQAVWLCYECFGIGKKTDKQKDDSTNASVVTLVMIIPVAKTKRGREQ